MKELEASQIILLIDFWKSVIKVQGFLYDTGSQWGSAGYTLSSLPCQYLQPLLSM